MATISYRRQLANAQRKLEALQTRIEELIPLAADEPEEAQPVDNIVVGASVFVKHGRCTAKTTPVVLQGIVLAKKSGSGKQADLVRVRVGEGFDEETLTLFSAAVFDTEEAAKLAVAGAIDAYNKAATPTTEEEAAANDEAATQE